MNVSIPRMSLREYVTGLPRTFWYLCLGTLINRLGSFVVPFLTLFLTQEREFAPALAGSIVALNGLGALIAAPLGGQMADALGRRFTLIFSLVSSACVVSLLLWVREPFAIGIAVFLFGLLTDLFRPALNAAVADVVPPEARIRAYAIIYWTVNLGFSFALFVGGVVAHQGYAYLFIGDALTTLAFALLVFLKIPESRVVAQLGALPETAWRGLTSPLRDRVFTGFFAVNFVASFVFLQCLATLPLHMVDRGLGAADYGAMMALNGILIVLLQPMISRWAEGKHEGRLLTFAVLMVGAGAVLNGLAHSKLMFAVAVFAWTIGEILFIPLGATVVAELAPAEKRGRYQGVYQLSWSGGTLFAPLIGTWALSRFGSAITWNSMGVLAAAAAAWSIAWGNGFRKRVAANRASGAV